MNGYSLDLSTMDWIPYSGDTNVPYNEYDAVNIFDAGIFDKSDFILIPENTNMNFDDLFNSNHLKQFQKVFLYQKKNGLYNYDYLIEKLNFKTTVKENIIRYTCTKFPFVLDCVYDDKKKNIKNAVIISYIESSFYLFSPVDIPYLLTLFVVDDVLGVDFFYDFDFSCIHKKKLSLLEKEVDTLLKVNENKLSGICSIREAMNKDFSEMVSDCDFDDKSYQRFKIAIKRLDTSNYISNSFSTLALVLVSFFVVLSLTILYIIGVFLVHF